MPILDNPPFYSPWPLLGKALSRQWDTSRDNADTLAPIARAVSIDYDHFDTFGYPRRGGAVTAWEVGEDGFNNRFREFWDRDAFKWKIQYNRGTQDVPIWADFLVISAPDGGVAIAGGLSVFGGFYRPFIGAVDESGVGSGTEFINPDRLRFNVESGFYLTSDSAGWPTVNISFDGTNLGTGSRVFESTVTPNLRFRTLSAGSNVTLTENTNDITIAANSNDPGFYGVVFKQTGATPKVFKNDTLLVNAQNFYLTPDSTGKPVINWTGDVGEVNTASNLGSGSGLFAQKSTVDLQFKSLTAGTNITLTPSSTEVLITAATADAGGPGFYGVVFKQTGPTPKVFRNDTLLVNADNFYLTPNSQGKPILNFTGVSAGGAGTITGGTNLGSGAQVFESTVAPDLRFRTIVAGSANITVVQGTNDITIDATSSGGGGGFYGVIFKQTGATPKVFRNDTLLVNADHFYIMPNSIGKPVLNWTGDLGEVNTASNLGAGNGIFAQKSGVDLQFKSITAGANITLNPSGTELQIVAASGGGGSVATINEFNPDGTTFTAPSILRYNTGSGFYLSADSAGSVEVNFHDHVEEIVAGTNVTVSTVQSGAGKVVTVNSSSGSDPGPGFYGVIFKQTGPTPKVFKNDTFLVNAANFYLTNNSQGKPVLNFTNDVTPNYTAAQNFGSSVEWTFTHNLATSDMVWSVYDDQGEAFIPQRVDVSNPNIAYFYVCPATAGRAVLLASGGTAVGSGETNTASNLGVTTYGLFAQKSGVDLQFKSLTAGANITLAASGTEVQITAAAGGNTIDITDTIETIGSISTLAFNPNDFYLTKITSGPQVNLVGLSGALKTRTATFTPTANAVWFTIPWTSTVYDFGGWVDPLSDRNFKVPANVAVVRVLGNIVIPQNVGNHLVRIRKNGQDSTGLPYVAAPFSSEGGSQNYNAVNAVSAPIPVKQGDVFYLQLKTANFSGLSVQPTLSWFSIEKVA